MYSNASKQILPSDSNVKIVSHDTLKLWTESFGNPCNTPILLLMGAGEPGIMWPTSFCQDLASQGHYIIRFDYRDVGKSSPINYEKSPYTVMDITQDVLVILKAYNIKKAHCVGFSMGGQIAQFMGAYFPDHTLSITLIGTSSSFEEGFSAFGGKVFKGKLSAPDPSYIKWATQPVDPHQNFDQKKQYIIENFKRINGSLIPIDEKLYNSLAEERIERTTLHNSYINHAQAMMRSYHEHQEASNKISLPTLIIHGTVDPVFPLDHAESLHKLIPNSDLKIIKNMGHFINSNLFSEIIDLITSHIKFSKEKQ